MTAGGFLQAIPTKKLDILFCGCSCVDYSTLSKNGKKKAAEDLAAIEEKFRDVLDKGDGDPDKMRGLVSRGGRKAVKEGLLDRIANMEDGVDVDDAKEADDENAAPPGPVNNSAERVSLDNHMNDGKNLLPTATMQDIRLDQSFVDSICVFIRKLQQDGGESGESCRTFFAALMLIVKHRPKTIILENVFGAPWRLYTLRIFPRIGYYATFVRVDSKDYYIPQTRQRGYLVAIDVTAPGFSRNEPGVTRAMAEAIATAWVDNMKLAERRASSPASSFLRSPEDPIIIQARADMEGNMTAAKSASWALSSIRHDRERDAIVASGDLRYARQPNPFSHKVVRHERVVYAQFPDFAWLQFWKKQVVRCVDLVDIRLALSLASGNDIRFRPYLLDISQNVDRNGSATKKGAGIIGCITPKGQPIVTDLMRPITGFEALALQGMPVDNLVISTESQAQLHNLAGNAMTVTVVGAATLALLLSVAEHGPVLFGRLAGPRVPKNSFLPSIDGQGMVRGEENERGEICERGEQGAHGGLFGDLAALSSVAAGGHRACFCQYSSPILETQRVNHKWLICMACGHTACSGCSGNSRHVYGRGSLPASDQPKYSSTEARVELLKLLPMSFVVKAPRSTFKQLQWFLSFVPKGASESFARKASASYRSVVQDILGNDAHYYFDGIKITEDVTVCYKAEHSIARLVLSKNSVTMYIYIDPSHREREVLRKPASSTTTRINFDLDYQPIARVVFSSDGSELPEPEWSVWINDMTDLIMESSMAEDGTITTGNINFENEPDGQVHLDDLVRLKSLVDHQIANSVFEPLRDCGTPLDELRVKRSRGGSPRVFFMRHCDQAGAHEDDPWVWTLNIKKLESHEYRETLIQFRTGKQTQPKPESKASPKGKGKAKASPEEKDIAVPDFMAGPAHTTTLAAFIPGYWARFDSKTAPQAHQTTHSSIHWDPEQAIITATCHSPLNPTKNSVPLARILLPPLPAFPAPSGQLSLIHHTQIPPPFHLAKIPTTQRDSFLHIFSFAAADFQRALVPRTLTHLHNGDWIPAPACLPCTLSPPKVHHYQSNAFELRSEALTYELAVRALPVPVTLAARWHQTEGVELVVHLAPKVLASRALSYLLQAHPHATAGVKAGAVTKLKVELDYAPPSDVALGAFAAQVRPCAQGNVVGLEPGAGVMTGQPPRFAQRGMTLRKSQMEAVRWMVAREVAAAGYVECEMEEDVVRGLNLRVVGKAEWVNQFPFSPRGGVVGHEIGYGKTVVMLGLVDHRKAFDGEESIRERREEMEKVWWGAEEPKKQSFLHLKATLVIVPAHITGQWKDEATKFLGLNYPRLLVIPKLKDLRQLARELLEAAEVIILSKAVFQETDFFKQLDLFSTTARASKLAKGRELEHLHETAMSAMRAIMAQYLDLRSAGMSETDATNVVNKDAGRRLDDVEAKKDYLGTQLPTDSSRKGKLKNNPKKRSKSGNGKAISTDNCPDDDDDDDSDNPPRRKKPPQGATKTINWTITSWLQNLSFARIIWDEFSYEDENLSLFFQMSMANAKYLLSATPTLATLKDVCDVAKKFRVHVARAEPQMMPGLPKITQGPVQDQMTKCEEFRAFSSGVKSVDMAVHRHRQAEIFVAGWFRSNQLDDGEQIDVEEMIIASEMSPQNAARYHLAAQDVEDAFGAYERIPMHVRQETPIHKGDIRSKDDDELCMALLVHLASGVGRETESIDTFVNRIRRSVELLERQWKALVDKLMWLYAILEGFPKSTAGGARDQAYDQIRESMAGFLDRWSAPGRTGNYGSFGGREMYARDLSILLGRARQIRDERRLPPFAFSLPGALTNDWPEKYPVSMALFTWIDFWTLPVTVVDDEEVAAITLASGDRVKIDPPLPNNILVNLLADLWTIFVKMDGDADPLGTCRREGLLVDKTLDLATRESRTVSRRVTAMRSPNVGLIGILSPAERAQLLVRVAAHKPPQPPVPRRGGGGKPDHGLGEGISAWGPLPPLTDKKAMVTETRQAFGEVLRKEKALATARREWRFARRLAEVFSLGQGVDQLCDQCGREFVAPGMSFLIVACGHRVCHECRANLYQSCGVDHCGVFTLGRAVLRCAGPGVRSGGTVERWNKAGLVAELVGKIPSEDFIIVFAQYQAILAAIKLELERRGVSLTLLTSGVAEASAQLELFKAGNGGRVILIDIGSDHSAGSNITNANHVIFAHPYISTDPSKHLRVMRQAAGRCVRQGQEKKVKLYHFMTRNTIEERILRDRAAEDPRFAAVFERSHVPAPWWLDEGTAVYRPRLVLREHRPRPAPHPDAGYQAGDKWEIDPLPIDEQAEYDEMVRIIALGL